MFDDDDKGIRVIVDLDGKEKKRLRRSRKRGDNPWARLVWGIAILTAGVIGWLDHTGQLHARDYLEWWPLILIALGLAHLAQPEWITGIVLIILGVLFLPTLPFLPHFHPAMILGVWPLLISVGGVTLIRQALQPAVRDAAQTNSFHTVAVMGGVGRGVASSDFRGGDAVAVMGGCQINLGAAKIVNEAVIDVLAFWGGIEIRVPRGWQVENQVVAILGGIVDKTDRDVPAGAPTLIIRGSVIMGGFEVKHPKE
ncbi:MAG TPA: LiaF domain-containing protein [Thermoanaerobaculia bacterium]|jgi:hypothetical protein|nr:LiaF domain-containing protein [Thermoanaerobaculia bacterium]